MGYAVLSQSTHPCPTAVNPVCVCALQVAGRPASSYEYYRTFSTKVQINGWKVSTINIFLFVWVGVSVLCLFSACFIFLSVHFALNIFVLVRQYGVDL